MFNVTSNSELRLFFSGPTFSACLHLFGEWLVSGRLNLDSTTSGSFGHLIPGSASVSAFNLDTVKLSWPNWFHAEESICSSVFSALCQRVLLGLAPLCPVLSSAPTATSGRLSHSSRP